MQFQPELSESQAMRASALGPLTELLDDPRVVEVMLNADGVVWVERIGEGLVRTRITVSAADADRMLCLVASDVLVELNAQSPSLSAKLPPPWGARLQAAIPTIVDAPAFALRKPARIVFSLDDHVSRGILSPRQRAALADAVRAHDNILIGGGTGSGKTDVRQRARHVIAEDTTDRVHIFEDTPEIQCEGPNRLQVLVQQGVHSWRDAIMAAMRFRPDRILVGEVRDGSALELLKAWNMGHPGGIAVIHANDTRAMLDRLCQLIEEVVHLAPRALVAEQPMLRPACHSDSPQLVRWRTRAAQLLLLAFFLLLPVTTAQSGSFGLGGLGGLGGGMPWEGPLQQFLSSLTGPISQVVGAVAIIGLGLGIAFSEGGSMMRKALWVVMGLAIAFNAASWGPGFLGYSGGVLV